MFTWTIYKGRPEVYDTVSHVFYFGFKNMQAARIRAEQLNRGK